MEFSSGGKRRRNTIRLSLCALHFGWENIVSGLACAEISQRLIEAPPTPPVLYFFLTLSSPPRPCMNEVHSQRNGCSPPHLRSNQRACCIHSPLNMSQSDRDVLGAVHRHKDTRVMAATAGLNKDVDQPNHRLQCGIDET